MIRLAFQWKDANILEDRDLAFDNFYYGAEQYIGDTTYIGPRYNDGYYTINGKGEYPDTLISKTLQLSDLSGWGSGIQYLSEIPDPDYSAGEEVYSQSGYRYGDRYLSGTSMMTLNYRMPSVSDSSMWLLLDVIDYSSTDDKPVYFDQTVWVQVMLNSITIPDARTDVLLPTWYSFLKWYRDQDAVFDKTVGHL